MLPLAPARRSHGALGAADVVMSLGGFPEELGDPARQDADRRTGMKLTASWKLGLSFHARVWSGDSTNPGSAKVAATCPAGTNHRPSTGVCRLRSLKIRQGLCEHPDSDDKVGAEAGLMAHPRSPCDPTVEWAQGHNAHTRMHTRTPTAKPPQACWVPEISGLWHQAGCWVRVEALCSRAA